MDQEEIDQLKELAEQATAGPWSLHNCFRDTVVTGDPEFVIGVHAKANNVFMAMSQANAAYIAAANPQATLELIAENERLKIELHDMNSSGRETLKDFAQLDKEADWLAEYMSDKVSMSFGDDTGLFAIRFCSKDEWRRIAREAVEKQSEEQDEH